MCVCSEDAECQDTDSDAADPKDCGKVKVKWTQEEVIFEFIDKALNQGPDAGP